MGSLFLLSSQSFGAASLIQDFHDLNPKQTHKSTPITLTFTWAVTFMLPQQPIYVRWSNKAEKITMQRIRWKENHIMGWWKFDTGGKDEISALLSVLTKIQEIPGNWLSEPLIFSKVFNLNFRNIQFKVLPSNNKLRMNLFDIIIFFAGKKSVYHLK